MISAGTAAVMYFVSQYITLEVQQIVVVVFGVWGIISVMVLDRFVWRLTPPKQMKLAGMLNFARANLKSAYMCISLFFLLV